MIKYIIITLTLLQAVFFATEPLQACSAFSISKGNKVLIGSSVDIAMEVPLAYFEPGSDGKYGKVIFYFDRGFMSVQGGFNEHGLVVEGAGLPERSYPGNIYNKPVNDGSLAHILLEECTTVEEAINEVSKYYWSNFLDVHVLIADKYGNSAIIEWNETDLVALRKKGDYQVMTNFFNFDTLNARWYSCYRYRAANAIFEESSDVSLDLLRKVCEAVHLEGINPTLHSNIYDPVNGEVYVFYFHNFDEVVKFNMEEELAKGKHQVRLSELYYQTKAVYPVGGEKVKPGPITFKWMGDAANYELVYSTNPDFTGQQSFVISDREFVKNLAMMPEIILLFGLFIFSGMVLRKRKTLLLLSFFIVGAFGLSCEKSIVYSPAESNIEHTMTVNNLQPNTQYYWKVVAMDNVEYKCESYMETFITGIE